MNTASQYIPVLTSKRARDNVIALDGLEFAFSREQLQDITKLHNDGFNYKQISKMVNRNEYEVIIALLHQVRQGVEMRPFYGGR